MSIRNVLITAMLIFSSLSSIGAASDNPKAEAAAHTQTALQSGETGQANLLIQHAEAALPYLQAAEQNQRSTYIELGIAHLEAAIYAAKKNNLRIATDQAKEALENILKPRER